MRQAHYLRLDTIAAMPEELQASIKAELQDNEQILWAAQPLPWRFWLTAIPLVLVGLFIAAFAAFCLYAAFGFDLVNGLAGLSFFPAVAGMFVLVGLGLVTSPIYLWRKAQQTAYVVTTKRAIIFGGGWFSKTTHSFAPSELQSLHRKQFGDGSGDLIFKRNISVDQYGDQHTTDIGFFAIAEPKAVEYLIRTRVAMA